MNNSQEYLSKMIFYCSA